MDWYSQLGSPGAHTDVEIKIETIPSLPDPELRKGGAQDLDPHTIIKKVLPRNPLKVLLMVLHQVSWILHQTDWVFAL